MMVQRSDRRETNEGCADEKEFSCDWSEGVIEIGILFIAQILSCELTKEKEKDWDTDTFIEFIYFCPHTFLSIYLAIFPMMDRHLFWIYKLVPLSNRV